MTSKTTATILAALTLLPCCGDDTIVISTFSVTNFTNGNVDGGDGSFPTEPDETTGEPSTDPGGMSETTRADEATTEPVDPTTTGADIDPVQDPPFGCGVIIEALINAPIDQRYIVADVSACARPQQLAAALQLFETKEKSTSTVAASMQCVIFGGSGSAVADSIGFQQADLALAGSDVSSFGLELFVDGVLTDNVRVSAILQGQTWQNMPSAPDQPIRRAEDFSWRILPAHTPGCALFVD